MACGCAEPRLRPIPTPRRGRSPCPPPGTTRPPPRWPRWRRGKVRSRLAGAAQAWIDPIAAAATAAGLDMPLTDRLHRLLLLRRGAPTEAVWRLEAEDGPGFVLNLPAFLDSDGQLDFSDIAEAVETAVIALSFAAPQVRDIDVGMADLAGLLAALGIDYASDAARDIARCLAADRARTGGCGFGAAGPA